jgi:hypothetical protein
MNTPVTPQLWVGVGNTAVRALAAVVVRYLALPERARVPASFLGLCLEPALDSVPSYAGTPDVLRVLRLDTRPARARIRRQARDASTFGDTHAVWLPSAERLLEFNVEPSGASQLRFLGRLTLALQLEVVAHGLRASARELASVAGGGTPDGIRVRLMTATASGAGGMLLDVAQQAARLLQVEHMDAVFLMPEDAARPRALANTFASLLEWHLVRSRRRVWQGLDPRAPWHGDRHDGVPDLGYVLPLERAHSLADTLVARLHASIEAQVAHVADRIEPVVAASASAREQAPTLAAAGCQRILATPIDAVPGVVAYLAAARRAAPNASSDARPAEGYGAQTHLMSRRPQPSAQAWLDAIAPRLPSLVSKVVKAVTSHPEDQTDPELIALALGHLVLSQDERPQRIREAIELLRRETQPVILDLLQAARTDHPEERRKWVAALQNDAGPFLSALDVSHTSVAEVRERWQSTWGEALPLLQSFRWWQLAALLRQRVFRARAHLRRRVIGVLESEMRALMRDALTGSSVGLAAHMASHVARYALRAAVGLEPDAGSVSRQRGEPQRVDGRGALDDGDAPPGSSTATDAADGGGRQAGAVVDVPVGLAEVKASVIARLLQAAGDAARKEWSTLEALAPDDGEAARGAWVVRALDRWREAKRAPLLVLDPQQRAHDKLRALVSASRPRVFAYPSEGEARQAFCVAVVPDTLLFPGGREAFVAALAQFVQESLRCTVITRDADGLELWLYHEDRQRHPRDLEHLRHYRDAHDRAGDRGVYAADRRLWEGLTGAELGAAPASPEQRCGNDGCPCDITATPRTQRTCPNCRRPIRTRCGNPECTHELPPGCSERVCPGCGGFNYGAWWRCARHGKVEEVVPIDKERCPRCVREHQRDSSHFPLESIGLRADRAAVMLCPNCRRRRARDPEQPVFEIPSVLQPFVRDGVNGHALRRFGALAGEAGLVERLRCPVCDTWLIPVHLPTRGRSTGRSVPESRAWRGSNPAPQIRPHEGHEPFNAGATSAGAASEMSPRSAFAATPLADADGGRHAHAGVAATALPGSPSEARPAESIEGWSFIPAQSSGEPTSHEASAGPSPAGTTPADGPQAPNAPAPNDPTPG